LEAVALMSATHPSDFRMEATVKPREAT